MSSKTILLVTVLALLALRTSASSTTKRMSPGGQASQPEDLQQLRDRVKTLEDRLINYTGLPEHLATLDGKLITTNETKDLVDASIRSSDRTRDIMTYAVSILLGLFTIGGGVFLLRLRGIQERARARTDELYVATQIARAVGDLLRGDQLEKDVMKRVWWTSAYQKLLNVEEEGSNDPDWLNWKAYTLRRLREIDEALAVARMAADRAPARSPQRARALYNIACYSAMLANKPQDREPRLALTSEALRALRQAVRAQPLLKAVAAGDTDFDLIKTNPELSGEFAEIVHPERVVVADTTTAAGESWTASG